MHIGGRIKVGLGGGEKGETNSILGGGARGRPPNLEALTLGKDLFYPTTHFAHPKRDADQLLLIVSCIPSLV